MTRNTDRLQLLVIEDEALIVMDLEYMIETAGHRMVASAASVRSLEQLDPEMGVDVAFVDLQLAGGSSGLDAADYIRKVWPDALIVFVTANAKALMPNIEKGHAVVPKPFTEHVILTTLLFLNEGIRTPPPKSTAPRDLVMNTVLERRLQLA